VTGVKKLLRLRTLLALVSLALVIVLLTAAQGIGQTNVNQAPHETSTPENAATAGNDSVEPAEDSGRS
jgi:hypothetical protein